MEPVELVQTLESRKEVLFIQNVFYPIVSRMSYRKGGDETLSTPEHMNETIAHDICHLNVL